MTASIRNPTDRTDRDRQFVPNGWTAVIVDGETVFRSPSGDIETTDVERVQQTVHTDAGGQR